MIPFAGWLRPSIIALALAPVAAPARVIGHMTPAEPVTEARIAALPVAERQQWSAYLARSHVLMAADKATLAAEREGGIIPAGPPEGSPDESMPLDRTPEWYTTAEARRVADNIVSFQTPAGGWGKNQDRSGPARRQGQSYVPIENLPGYARSDIQALDARWRYVGTIDNGATITEMRFLARVQRALPGAESDRYRASFVRGTRYLLSAQFPNGGWPQVYPLQGGYHDALTYNDDAMPHVVGLLSDIAARDGDYAFVPEELAKSSRAAVERAIRVILATQVVIGGKRTAWGQQHDALRLQPVGARNFEPTALSTNESASLLQLLMRLPDPSSATVAAVHDGIAWLRERSLKDVAWTSGGVERGRRLIAKPGAGPIWARFYDLRTLMPIFGDRDRSIHDDVNELSLERRNGYSWFGSGPARAIKLYTAWSALHPDRHGS
jgi:PelA/Pel-15E family pectate lyase